MVELGLVGPIFIAMIFMLIIIGLWIYNSNQTSQAARLAAHHLAVTGKYDESQQLAYNHLNKTKVAASTREVTVYWSGDMACARAETEMETFLPGLLKLLDPSAHNWTGRVTISREAVTTGEYRFRSGNQKYFN